MKQLSSVLAPIAVLWGTAFFSNLATADDDAVAPPPTAAAPDEDQIIVRGKPIEQLRLRIRIAEDAFYSRFNEINSDDRYDVDCFMRAETGTRIKHRICEYKGQRELDENYGAALLGAMNGQTGPPPELFLAARYEVEKSGGDEMRRLPATDPVLKEDLLRLGQAYQALDTVTGSRETWTLEHEILGDAQGLPFGARHMVDVRVGVEPWTHSLDGHTFTLTSVSGAIRGLRAKCEHGGEKLRFEHEVEWTLPSDWGRCTLIVSAKRETTFRFVEFE